MSHITTTEGAIFIPKDGLIDLLNAVKEFCPDLEFVQGEKHYRTWKDNHDGKLVGDWPLPDGWTASQIGEGAHHVIRVTEAALKSKFSEGSREASSAPYEIGVVPVRVVRDANDNVVSATYDEKGSEYILMTDWWSSGNGILNLPGVGGRVRDAIHPQTGNKTEMSFGDLYMHYRMVQARSEAELQGDTMVFHQESDGTYTATSDTTSRLGVS